MSEKVETPTKKEDEGILSNLNRRDFIKKAAAAVGGLTFGSMALTNFEAAAQEGMDYVIVFQLIKGGANSVGPPCRLTNFFKKGEQIVWHGLVFDTETGKKVNDPQEVKDRGMKMWVELSSGEKVSLHHGAHPPDESPKIYFWGGGWKISPGVSTGKYTFKMVVEDKEGRRGVLETFGDPEVTTFPYAIEIVER